MDKILDAPTAIAPTYNIWEHKLQCDKRRNSPGITRPYIQYIYMSYMSYMSYIPMCGYSRGALKGSGKSSIN